MGIMPNHKKRSKKKDSDTYLALDMPKFTLNSSINVSWRPMRQNCQKGAKNFCEEALAGLSRCREIQWLIERFLVRYGAGS